MRLKLSPSRALHLVLLLPVLFFNVAIQGSNSVAANGAFDVIQLDAKLLATFDTENARQAVAVDRKHFFAVNNAQIDMHRKSDGLRVKSWDEGRGAILHLDSGAIDNGRIYAAHSNYPARPMTSSVEVWDATTLEHVDSHSIGIRRGSFTWLDRHGNDWWGAFGNYDKVQKGESEPYGTTDRTQVVRLDASFEVVESWVLPAAILDRMRPMSNSGGSWGPDGLLYLTGHDRPEIYVVKPPAMGSELVWVATIHAPWLEGQGIAWDRSESERILWGVRKRDRKVFRMRIPSIQK